MKKLTVALKDFLVTFVQSDRSSTDVKVYVDGNLNEDSQYTWYLRVLLNKAIELQEENTALKKENRELKK